MLWQMYGWWSWLIALPPATGLGIWVWLSPTARHALHRANPRGRAEHRLAILRAHGRISADEYQDAMADLAHHRFLHAFHHQARPTSQPVA